MSMNEVLPGLWIGDLPSSLDVQNLKSHNISSIVSAMRGRLNIKETFIRHQILLDDEEDADVLQHFLPSISFIQAELDKGRGVLVHCHAGVSRSATIMAAYLMYTKNIDPKTALQMIRTVRPIIEPNQGFLRQLDAFHQARFKVSFQDKSTRMFYLDHISKSGNRTLSRTDVLATLPSTTNVSGTGPRRYIRCKMCRQELAAREHMIDHGDFGSSTKTTASHLKDQKLSLNSPSLPTGGEDSSELSARMQSLPENITESPVKTGDAVKTAANVAHLATRFGSNPEVRSPFPMTMMPSISPCILSNPKCSGYFVEPMKWMEQFLEAGELAGKIICPNPKCHAKLGNFDWAGMCCGCKSWVTPGFCVNRSKVDEIVN